MSEYTQINFELIKLKVWNKCLHIVSWERDCSFNSHKLEDFNRSSKTIRNSAKQSFNGLDV